jgi:hypothetical protein
MARKIKSQKFTQIFKFPSWIVIGLLLVVFIYVMYNQFREGNTGVTDTKNIIPSELAIGSTGNNTSSNGIPTSIQIQARELVKKWEEKLIVDKTANNTVAADIDQYNIDFYKSMS